MARQATRAELDQELAELEGEARELDAAISQGARTRQQYLVYRAEETAKQLVKSDPVSAAALAAAIGDYANRGSSPARAANADVRRQAAAEALRVFEEDAAFVAVFASELLKLTSKEN